MFIFLTGATGFIGSKIVPELIGAGHQVVGLTRSDAVIHCAFDHDFSRFAANCEKDGRAIRAMGQALAGSDRPLVITSGTGVGATERGRLATEDVMDLHHPTPRIASEAAGAEMSAVGVKVIAMRLPQVHDTTRQGLVTPYVMTAKQNGFAGYVGEGRNRWPAAHVSDVVRLYRLAVEQGRAGERFHAVDEEGVSTREIAEAVAAGLGVPAESVPQEEAAQRLGWLGAFAAMDMPASSAWTRERLGWRPTGPGLIADLKAMDYSVFG